MLLLFSVFVLLTSSVQVAILSLPHKCECDLTCWNIYFTHNSWHSLIGHSGCHHFKFELTMQSIFCKYRKWYALNNFYSAKGIKVSMAWSYNMDMWMCLFFTDKLHITTSLRRKWDICCLNTYWWNLSSSWPRLLNTLSMSHWLQSK